MSDTSGWDDDDLADDDREVDDIPSGTDADFSGDEISAARVSARARVHRRFSDLSDNARSDPELAAILAGRRKAILIHKPYQYAQRLDEVVGYARRQVVQRCSVGLVVPFRQSADSVRGYMARFPNTALRLADPELHLHSQYYAEVQPTAERHWTYFHNPVPAATDVPWTLQVLTEQLRCGATVLLTPTGKVEEADADDSLEDAMRRASLARSIVGDAPLFVNLTFAHRWLSHPPLRERLLAELVDSQEQHWYLRFRWPVIDPAHGQLAIQQLLDGYAELARVSGEENKVLFLPNSDLTGWVAMTLGASGFGTATSIADRRFADKRRMGVQPGQPRPEPKKRYFSRPILHTVEQETHRLLLGTPGYSACRCRFCVRTLRPDRTTPTTWDLASVGYHYIQKAAMLTAATAQPTGRARALHKVNRALAIVNGLPSPIRLTGDDRPSHLELWQALLS